MRRTKIICTLGPASDDPAVMKALIENGMDVARFNFSHGTHEEQKERMDKLKKQIKECQDYDAKLGHLALDQIKLNLDDGVKVNYRKAQTGRDGKFYEVLADSKNIMANDALWKEYLTEWPHEDE